MSDLINAEKIKQFIRFCVVGAICTLIDSGIYYISYASIGYRLAMILGFSISLIFNYLLNIYWSFNSSPNAKNIVGILLAHLFNIFIVRMSLMWIFINVTHLSESIAFIPTLAISMLTNFIIIRFVINKSR